MSYFWEHSNWLPLRSRDCIRIVIQAITRFLNWAILTRPGSRASSINLGQGGSNSCVAGGFCAYHGTFKRNGQNVFYGVMPHMSSGSGCDSGCGASTPLNNQTSVASHELIEAVTDPAVGLANVYGPPLAWHNKTYGEIGDICNAQQSSIILNGLA